jgi:transposase
MTGALHALCNAHHLRELKALVEIEKADWAGKMQRLLRRARHATNLAREPGVPLKPGLIALIGRCHDGILANGLSLHAGQPALVKTRRRGRPPRRVGHNLLPRLSTRKHDVLRFPTDPSVPFTDNLAEPDGRMRKLRQKISGGFRSEDGAKDFAVIRSVLDGQEAGLEYASDLERRSGAPGGRHPGGLTGLPTWAVTVDSFFDPTGKNVPTTQDQAATWFAAVRKSAEPSMNGHVYQDYPERDLRNYRWAYWGDAFRSLLQVKQTYDPTSFFLHGQSISEYPGEPDIKRSNAPGRFPDVTIEYETYSRVSPSDAAI